MGPETPRLGVIEGFYGTPWPADSRLLMAEWLPAIGISHYLYAPKADRALRRGWRDPWPAPGRAALAALVRRGEQNGLSVGAGLSPFAAYEEYDGSARRALRSRVAEIEQTGVATLAILFDDMPGSVADLAARQAAIIADVAHWVPELALLVCPTYYSDDPVLDRLFGPRPPTYLADLGAALPAGTALLWTGPRVCSARIDVGDLPGSDLRGGAPLALWDNYPVNDSRERSAHLYLDPLPQRDPALAAAVDWHWCNAMNQPALSLPALAGLAALYGRRSDHEEAVMAAAGITAGMVDACRGLSAATVDDLAADARARLVACARGEGMAARELARFLAGDYAFDPDCLTD